MKIDGREVKDDFPEDILVLPRMDHDIVFRARGVPDMEEFKKLVPEPMCPTLLKKGRKVNDSENPDYLKQVADYGEKRFAYLVLKTLEPTNIEWDTVDMGKPSTWKNWTEELRKAGLSEPECNRIIALVLSANSLNEQRMKEAREAFLLGLPKE
jgi:hypothetical protein